MKRIFWFFPLIGIGCTSRMLTEQELMNKANEYAQSMILVDTHVDVPYRLREKMEDISQRTASGDFDYPRAKAGGLNAPFLAIYIPSKYEMNGAKLLADTLIDMVEGFVKTSPDKFVLATTPADVTAQFKTGKISLCLGMENGAPVEGKLENLTHFYKRGIRYITLTHGKDNHISDSSYDTLRTWKGISRFGEQVVWEMNRLGIMVDISHVSDDAFFAVMAVSKAPAIASHSSCRHFTPGWQRNMSDDMIRLLAQHDGVIQINFGSSFINNEYRLKDSVRRAEIAAFVKTQPWKDDEARVDAWTDEYEKAHPIGFYATVQEVADHIDHVVKIAGIDHVGLGSDFDGLGDSLPTGLKDVSQFPNLIAELIRRGYSRSAIEKICSGNLIRVWKAVEAKAKLLQKS